LHRYTRLFVQSDAAEALQYLYLVCLNADLPAPRGDEQVALAHEYVRQLVMETRHYSELLGDVRNDGTKVVRPALPRPWPPLSHRHELTPVPRRTQPGQIERDLKLLHLADSRAYLLGIVKSAAERADLEQRFSEAILLYNLAEEYDAVIAVLNVELGNALAKPAGAASASTAGLPEGFKGTVGMAAGHEDVALVAKSILEHYDRAAGMGGKVSRRRRETCEVLMRLKEAMSLYESGKLEQALQVRVLSRVLFRLTDPGGALTRSPRPQTIESTNLIPLHSDLVHLIRAAEDLASVDDAIVRNLDALLVATMTVLYRLHQQLRESPYGADPSRQQRMQELRGKARSLMMFAGMVRPALSLGGWSGASEARATSEADFPLLPLPPSLSLSFSLLRCSQLRYRLTSETYSQLTRLDVYLN